MRPWQRRALEALETETLVQRAQQAREAGDARDEEAFSEILYERHLKAFWAIAREKNQTDPDEAFGDVVEMFISSCWTFDPAKGSFDVWWRENVDRRFSVNRARERGGRSWDKVARVAQKVAGDLPTQLGRTPNGTETRDGVSRHIQNEAERAVRAAALKTGEVLEQDDLAVRVSAKLRKDGTTAALRDLSLIMAMDGSPLSLDARNSDQGSTLGDMLMADDSDEASSWLSVIEAILNEDELRLVLRRSADRSESGWRQIAAEEGVEWTELRKAWSDAVAKPLLPHAHFAYLTRTARFEPALDEPTDALARFRGRVSVAGGHALVGMIEA